MKTRIRIVEKPAGGIRFYCEELLINRPAIIFLSFLPIVGWLLLPLCCRWELISTDTLRRSFSTLTDAQTFLRTYTGKMVMLPTKVKHWQNKHIKITILTFSE